MSRIHPTSPPRFAVIVDGKYELAIPFPPARGRQIHLIAERSGLDGVHCNNGPVSFGQPLRPALPEASMEIGRLHVAEGQACIVECHIESIGSPPPDCRPFAAGGPCAHRDAVAVDSVVDGSVLAALCPDCDQQLSVAFLTCDHPNSIEISTLGEAHRTFLCNGCGCSYTTSR